jgi:hypothetical protein
MTFTAILTVLLQLFGALWMAGGAIVVNQARLDIFADKSLSELNRIIGELGEDPEHEPTDKGRSYWLLSGGILTLVSGAGLFAASPLALYPLTALVVHQGVYAWRQNRLQQHALKSGDREQAQEAAMSPTARNGAITSVVIWAVALVVLGTP